MADLERIQAGQAVYTPLTLFAYDWFVLGFSNRYLWKCPTSRLEDLYARNVSDNHLDMGVGTGYFLDRTSWPSSNPHISLLDLNPHSLAAAAKRIERYRPHCVTANVLEPLALEQTYHSVGLCYLLHCLPGSMRDKAAAVFDNVSRAVGDGGRIFGATIVQGDAPRSRPAQMLMNFYNRKGIFSNEHDRSADLRDVLETRFRDVHVELVGTVALFEARK